MVEAVFRIQIGALERNDLCRRRSIHASQSDFSGARGRGTVDRLHNQLMGALVERRAGVKTAFGMRSGGNNAGAGIVREHALHVKFGVP